MSAPRSTEEQYERAVDRLALKYDNYLRAEASRSRRTWIHRLGHDVSPETLIDLVRDDLATILLDDAAWEFVDAMDISDIAYDAAYVCIEENR